ncbi:MAG: hypothetical protein ACKVJJ_03595 [Fidelibacterota bacterium]|jgi:hypothetical protein
MKKNSIVTFLVILMTCVFLNAQDESTNQKPKDVLIEGEVIDLACFTSRGAIGKDHKSCATRCLTRGSPAGLLDKNGNVFVIVGPSPGYSTYAAETIRLNGQVENGRISPKKMEVIREKGWKEIPLNGGSPSSN